MMDVTADRFWEGNVVEAIARFLADEGWTRREYFIGTVLVSPTAQKGHFEVIDGQQRLTTFFLLLCALRQRFKGEPQYPLFTGLLSTSYTDSSGY